MLFKTMTVAAQGNDSELVARSLAGDRNAFGEIVARYQSLICSLAYAATGSLTQSEDLAQETFLAAWKQLAALREPAKLRAWLCAIARNQINNAFRKQGREPVSHATQLDNVAEPSAEQKAPVDEAISKEEETILWRSLESIPQNYREPLILFYREGQSVERVAAALEISEDTARQRLSRGRKLLQDQVTAFVEGALVRSIPGKAFTLGVLAALPGLTISSKAATMAAAAAKGSSAAKAAAATGIFGAIITPVMALIGTWLGYLLNVDTAKSQLERDFVKRAFKRAAKVWIALCVPMVGVLICSDLIAKNHPALLTTLLCGIVLLWVGVFAWLLLDQRKGHRRLVETLERRGLADTTKPAREYRSKATFLGLPLIHYRMGGNMAARRGTVRAWIAIGDNTAIGGLFAFGATAIAPISCGAFGLGLISFSACAFGVFAMGGMAVGYWAFGAMGVGWYSFSAFALAWKAAWGGVAVAREFACGGFAQALDANNDTARDFILSQPFFRVVYRALKWLPWLSLIWLLPVFRLWRVAKKENRQSA